jgi:TM2 domain-containing membrane protein YozV
MPLAKTLFRALPLLALLLLGALPVGAATLEITGPPGASVTINGNALGTLPLDGPLDLAAGRYRIESSLTGYVAFSQLVLLEQDDAHLVVHVRLGRLSRGTAWRSNILFAGLGQFYTGQPTRGWLYAGAEAAGLVTALVGEWQRSDHRKDYLRILEDYESQINQSEAERLRGEASAAYADMEDAAKLRDTGLIVAVSAIAVSIVDVLITFPHVAAGPGPVPPTTGYLEGMGTHDFLTSAHAGVRLTF